MVLETNLAVAGLNTLSGGGYLRLSRRNRVGYKLLVTVASLLPCVRNLYSYLTHPKEYIRRSKYPCTASLSLSWCIQLSRSDILVMEWHRVVLETPFAGAFASDIYIKKWEYSYILSLSVFSPVHNLFCCVNSLSFTQTIDLGLTDESKAYSSYNTTHVILLSTKMILLQ